MKNKIAKRMFAQLGANIAVKHGAKPNSLIFKCTMGKDQKLGIMKTYPLVHCVYMDFFGCLYR